jgi:hypothetical protein
MPFQGAKKMRVLRWRLILIEESHAKTQCRSYGQLSTTRSNQAFEPRRAEPGDCYLPLLRAPKGTNAPTWRLATVGQERSLAVISQ